MTDRELELFRRIIDLAKMYDDSNPDVGMGPSRWSLAQDEAKGLSFEVTEEEIEQALEWGS
jgi:hypothetical protein